MRDLKKTFLLYDVLHEKQYGFRENSTTELAVNQIVDELIEAGQKKYGQQIVKGLLFNE